MKDIRESWTRRNFILGCGAATLLPRFGYAQEPLFSIRNAKGSSILNRALFEQGFWDDSKKTFYISSQSNLHTLNPEGSARRYLIG